MTREDEIEERLAKITPTPWEVHVSTSGHSRYENDVYIIDEAHGDTICHMDSYARAVNDGKELGDDGVADATFFYHAPEDIRYLLDKVTSLENQIQDKLEEKEALGRDHYMNQTSKEPTIDSSPAKPTVIGQTDCHTLSRMPTQEELERFFNNA